MKPILQVQNLSKDFIKSLDLIAKGLNRIGQSYKEEVVHAVDDVNFSIFKGEIVGVVGEQAVESRRLGVWLPEFYRLQQDLWNLTQVKLIIRKYPAHSEHR